MPKTDNLTDFLTDIADGIRTKTGTTDPIPAQNMRSVIESIPSGVNPEGKIEIKNTEVTDVTNYAQAQVVEPNLTAENIKEGINVLGITGTLTSGGGGAKSISAIKTPFKASTDIKAGEIFYLGGKFTLSPTYDSNSWSAKYGEFYIQDDFNKDRGLRVAFKDSGGQTFCQVANFAAWPHSRQFVNIGNVTYAYNGYIYQMDNTHFLVVNKDKVLHTYKITPNFETPSSSTIEETGTSTTVKSNTSLLRYFRHKNKFIFSVDGLDDSYFFIYNLATDEKVYKKYIHSEGRIYYKLGVIGDNLYILNNSTNKPVTMIKLNMNTDDITVFTSSKTLGDPYYHKFYLDENNRYVAGIHVGYENHQEWKTCHLNTVLAEGTEQAFVDEIASIDDSILGYDENLAISCLKRSNDESVDIYLKYLAENKLAFIGYDGRDYNKDWVKYNYKMIYDIDDYTHTYLEIYNDYFNNSHNQHCSYILYPYAFKSSKEDLIPNYADVDINGFNILSKTYPSTSITNTCIIYDFTFVADRDYKAGDFVYI